MPAWSCATSRTGTWSTSWSATVAVPSTLKGVLQSRLDALSLDERNLLQRASIVGRVFWDLAVAALDEGRGSDERSSARGAWRTCDAARSLLQREVSQFASAREFLFKHALLRDVAYDGVLRAHRERYHRRAADWLAETSAAVGRQDEYAAVIAEHYERPTTRPPRGGSCAQGQEPCPSTPSRRATRMLDSALRAVSEDDHHLRFDILLEQEALQDRLGDRDAQLATMDSMLALADSLDPPRQVQLHLVQSRNQFMHSDYTEARVHADAAVELATTIDHAELRAEATLDLGKALTWDGEEDAAQVCLTEAVELARAVGRSALIGEGLRYLGMLAGNVGDFPTSLDVRGAGSRRFRSRGRHRG